MRIFKPLADLIISTAIAGLVISVVNALTVINPAAFWIAFFATTAFLQTLLQITNNLIHIAKQHKVR